MPNYIVPSVGAGVSAVEVLLASVYNFHDFGCAMGTFAFLMSLAAIFLLRKYNKEEAQILKEEKQKR